MESKTNNDAKWDWIPCNYNLKREINGKTVFWNLSPSIILTNPSGIGPDPNVKLFIDTEKSLQFSSELGWNWHKSWNLPNISVRLEIKDATTGELFLSPKNLYSHLFAVKAVLDHKDSFHLVDIGLRGVTKIELLDGHAFFSAIKFASTSYNNEGVKFHLVLSLYIMGEDDSMPKMLNSTISPPIFVDSRKSARDSQVLMEKKMSSFVEPFLPENLEKIFIKRENKRKNDIEIQIYNDVDGLFNYLTAPNIRHKVKHPLFLSLKFSKCVKLLYNSKIVNGDSLEELINFLQKQLCEDHKVKKPQTPPNTNYLNENRIFLLLFEETGDSFKTKKIIEAVEPIQSVSFGLLYSKNQLPENFVEVSNIPEMIAIYRRNFANLFSASKIRRQSMLDKDSDDSGKSDSEESSESEDIHPGPTKKLKSNVESCQNLAGLEGNSKGGNTIKDPFSLLREKGEQMNILNALDGKDDNLDKSSASELVEQQPASIIKTKSKNNIAEEDKNEGFTMTKESAGKRAHIDQQKNLISDQHASNNPNISKTANPVPINNSATPGISSIPAMGQQPQQSGFHPNPSSNNANILSLLESLNRSSPLQAANAAGMLNPFSNPALMALLTNNQNQMSLLNQQKNIAGLLGTGISQQQQNPSERELLLKALQKNAGGNIPPGFGMNYNYSMLNSLLMNPGLNANQFNVFDGIFGQNAGNPMGGLGEMGVNKPPNAPQNQRNSGPGTSNIPSGKPSNEQQQQLLLNSLLLKSQAQSANNMTQGNTGNIIPNTVGSDNNYLKSLLLQAMKNGNTNPAQLLNIASMLNKGSTDSNGVIKKEEDK